MNASTTREVHPCSEPPDLAIRVPGSKSLTNRALVLASLAVGPSTLRGALVADDTDVMIRALGSLGARLDRDGTTIRVEPIGDGTNERDPIRIDTGLSGTTSRFILPVAARSGRDVVVDGAEPLRRRPMGPILAALTQLGVSVAMLGEPGFLPVRLQGEPQGGGVVEVPAGESSQFLSALLLVAPTLRGGLVVDAGPLIAARPFVDLTVGIVRDFGGRVDEIGPGRFEVAPGGLLGRDYAIEPDATAASYFAAAAAITGGRVTLEGIGASMRQGDVRFLDVLERMGVSIERSARSTTVRGGTLHGIDVDLAANPDVAQTLAAVAVFADSPTRVTGVGFIRGHETDRLAAVVGELRRIGIDANETDDGFTVTPGPPTSGEIRTYDDHRMAMSFALIGLRVPGISVADPAVVTKTYPGFWEDFSDLEGPVGSPTPDRLAPR